jgi:hypothetical protein
MPDLTPEWKWDRQGHFWYTEDGKAEMSPAECLERMLLAESQVASLTARLEKAEGRKVVRCPVCDGNGQRVAPAAWGTTNPLSVECHACKGAGWFWSDALTAEEGKHELPNGS